ncbi:MAG: TIGR01777 family oxidoreductase [Pirellula sp.]
MFEYSTIVPVSQQTLFDYHARPGAIDRLIPPWESVRMLQRGGSLAVGTRVSIQNKIGPVPVRWNAEHTIFDPPSHFQDIQLSGPFSKWVHDHLFDAIDDRHSKLTDRVDFRSKFPGPLDWLTAGFIRSKVESMFRYRHQTTEQDLKLYNSLQGLRGGSKEGSTIAVTGATGMIGRRLCALASVLGFRVIRVQRTASKSTQSTSELPLESVVFDAKHGFDNPKILDGIDAVIHLAGFGIATRRWSADTKELIRSSRGEGTRHLVEHLLRLENPPRALVAASGVGLYGDCDDAVCNEDHKAGTGFLPELAQQWESETFRYANKGRRAVVGRLGMVLHPLEGALSKMLPLFQFGLGGIVGSGKQYWSWIHVDDAASAFLHLAINPESTGPYNLVAPESLTNRDFTKTLGSVLKRPTILPAPKAPIRLLIGEMADPLLFASTRALPKRLLAEGFAFRAPTLREALNQLLGVA